jgi:hypothetical protein
VLGCELGHALGRECMPLVVAVSALWNVVMHMSTMIHCITDISMSDNLIVGALMGLDWMDWTCGNFQYPDFLQ